MPRIADSEIQRLKKEFSLERLCAHYGIELKKQGRDFVAHCPLHNDRTPSFVVSPAKNLWNCLGKCGCGGSVIDLVMKKESVSFRHAVEKLLSLEGKLPSSQIIQTSNELSDAELMKQIVEFYHQTFLNRPQAMNYLQKRNCFHPEAVKKFKIGYANRTLGYRIEANTTEGKKLKQRLQKLGILRESGHEHLSGCVVFPLFDEQGNVVQIYGRRIIPKIREGIPSHLYLSGKHRGIFNAAAFKQNEIVLCESVIDALSFYCAGVTNVTCIYGVNGFSDEIFEWLKRDKINSVRLAYDCDEAGETAAKRDEQKLRDLGIEVWRIKLPLSMDANEVLVKQGKQSLIAAVRNAQWLENSSSKKIAAKENINLAAKKEPSVPAAIDEKLSLEKRGDYYFLELATRCYRLAGLEKNCGVETLKVTLRIEHEGLLHSDVVDLCRDTDRRKFIERAHEETRVEKEILTRDIGKILLAAERQQEQRLKTNESQPEKTFVMTQAEQQAALNWLQQPKLIEHLREAFRLAGIIGEEKNALIAYLAGVSRKLERPLAIIIQSASAAGKTTLMDAVLSFFPEEERIKYSAMTGQSLYYLGETNLSHKILAVVEEAGAEKASYALKLLQSEGELSIASTGKDPHTGRMITQEYHVQGPVMIFLTTTSVDLDEELQNRCLTLAVDESCEQTQRIHQFQRERRTLAGLVAREERKEILTKLKNAQRLLEPIEILNPFAPALKFPAEQTRNRRDHEKYLTLIDSIALLHQHQRPHRQHTIAGKNIQCVEVTLDDIAIANELAPEILSRSLDELPPQTRRLLDCIRTLVKIKSETESQKTAYTFSRREIKNHCGWSLTQVRIHLHRLVELEYIALRFGKMGSAFNYELLIHADTSANTSCIGLIDIQQLQKNSQKTQLRTPGGGKNGQVAGGGKTALSPIASLNKNNLHNRWRGGANAHLEHTLKT